MVPALLPIVLVAAWPAVSAATVIDKERFSGSGSDTVEECGRTLDHTFSFTGTGHVRVGKGEAGPGVLRALQRRLRTRSPIRTPAARTPRRDA